MTLCPQPQVYCLSKVHEQKHEFKAPLDVLVQRRMLPLTASSLPDCRTKGGGKEEKEEVVVVEEEGRGQHLMYCTVKVHSRSRMIN